MRVHEQDIMFQLFPHKQNTIAGVRIACEFEDYFGQVVEVYATGRVLVNLWDHIFCEWRRQAFDASRIVENVVIARELVQAA